MRRFSFESPPFVVYRIEPKPSSQTPGDAPSQYRLVPHGVCGALLLQALVQAVAIIAVLYAHYNNDLWAVMWRWVVVLVVYFLLAFIANCGILWFLNARSLQTIEALLNLCPEQLRRSYDSAFPSIYDGPSRLWKPSRHKRSWRMAKLTGLAMLYWTYFPFYLFRRRFPRLICNLTKLRSLKLWREDNTLQAFSAFAVVTCFVPSRRGRTPTAALHTKFLLSYFSPIIFGFAICVLVASLYHFWCGPKKATFMVGVISWFVLSLIYSLSILRQDFAALCKNYFKSRPFPNSMTQFANAQMARAPDLLILAHERWLALAVNVAIFGLAELYASFLHSLGD